MVSKVYILTLLMNGNGLKMQNSLFGACDEVRILQEWQIQHCSHKGRYPREREGLQLII